MEPDTLTALAELADERGLAVSALARTVLVRFIREARAAADDRGALDAR